MVLDQITSILKVGRPVVRMIPIFGESLDGALDLAIVICEHAQGVKSNKQISRDLSIHCANCTVMVVKYAQKKTTDHQTVTNFLRVLEKIAESTVQRERQQWIQRLINKDSDVDQIKELRQEMDDVISQFEIGALMRGEEALANIKVTMDEITMSMRNIELGVQEIQHDTRNVGADVKNIKTGIRSIETKADNVEVGVKNIQITQERLLTTEENTVLAMLRQVPAARHDSAQAPTGCFKHTREEMLAKILSWINNPFSEHFIFWLAGLAGTGKTTIVKTVCDIFDEQQGHKIVISFFISRRSAERRDPLTIIKSLAYQLSRRIPAVAEAVCDTLRRDPDILDRSVIELAQRLIADPLAAAEDKLPFPIVIVIDALDECSRQDNQQDAQRLLIKQLYAVFSRYRSVVRLLITSRLEKNLVLEFETMNHSFFMLHEIEKCIVAEDLERFLRQAFWNIAQKRPSASLQRWPPADEIIAEIVLRCGSLFIYASTIVKYVDNDDYSPIRRLESFLASTQAIEPTSESPYATIDELYIQVLVTAVKDRPCSEPACKRMRTVMGAILLLQEPLPAAILAGILSINEDEVNIDIAKLSSVLLVPSSAAEPIQIFHPSLHDFLTDPSRCYDDRFFIGITAFHGFLAQRCFQLMSSLLRYDICAIRDLSLLNEEVEDLPSRIHNNIPMELEYACRFWVDHLVLASSDDTELISAFEDFAKHKLLNWLEVMSLKRLLSPASIALKRAGRWCQLLKNYYVTAALIHDSERIIGEFYPAISVASLHVYRSALLFLPDNPLKRLESLTQPSSIRLVSERLKGWNAAMQVITAHSDHVRSITFSPDGAQIISGSDDRTIRVWDANTGGLQAELTGHSGHVRSVAFSPDGTQIASGSSDTTVRVWDSNTGRSLAQLTGHRAYVRSIAFSPDGTRIVSGSDDKTVRVWDTNTGKSLIELTDHSGCVRAVAFSPDGSRIVSGGSDKTVRVWNACDLGVTLTVFTGHTDQVWSVAFSPDGTRIISGSSDKTIRIWNMSTERWTAELTGHSGIVYSVAFSPDGARIVSGSLDKTVRVWDAKTGVSLAELTGHIHFVFSVAFSPDGTQIASGSPDETVRVWHANTRGRLAELTSHSGTVYSIAFSPDEKRIVSGSNDKSLRVWDANTGESLAELTGHSGYVRSVAFSPDGMQIVSGASDSTVRVWNANTRGCSAKFTGHSGIIYSVAFSPDKTQIVSGSSDKTIRVWNANTGGLLAELTGHSDGVYSVAFSPDGTQIVSGSEDLTVRIWDANTGASLAQLTGHTDWVSSVTFSPDGTRIVSRSWDGECFLWDTTLVDHIQYQNRIDEVEDHLTHVDSQIGSIATVDDDGWLHLLEPRLGRICWLSVNRRPWNDNAVSVSSSGTLITIGSKAGIVTILDISSLLGRANYHLKDKRILR